MSFPDSLAWFSHHGQLLLNSLSVYCKKWLVYFDPAKTVYQLCGLQVRIPDLFFYYNGHLITRVKHFRYLGYDLNTRGTFGLFINNLLCIIRSRTPMLKILFYHEHHIAIQSRRLIFLCFYLFLFCLGFSCVLLAHSCTATNTF